MLNLFRIKGSENFQTVGPDVLKKQAEHVLMCLLETLQVKLSLLAEKCEKSVLKRVAKVCLVQIYISLTLARAPSLKLMRTSLKKNGLFLTSPSI